MACHPHSYVFTSSRGKSFVGRLSCSEIVVKPGGKLDELCCLALSKLHGEMFDKVIYFVFGIPDICTLSKCKNGNSVYEESWLDLSIDHSSRLKRSIIDCEHRIQSCVYYYYYV